MGLDAATTLVDNVPHDVHVGVDVLDLAERELSIALAMCPTLERHTMHRLVTGLGSAAKVWEAAPEQWQAVCGIRTGTVDSLDRFRRTFPVRGAETRLAERGIRCYLPTDPAYPQRVRDLPDAPLVLFAMGGTVPWNTTEAIAVVGTRRASSYGLEAAKWIGETLARHGIQVVSGMALGIDGAAHRGALEAEGVTIGVLACGVDVCYPPAHQNLHRTVRTHGVLVSEYPPGSLVSKHRFPERNRLIAALSAAVVVVQAGEKSGALRTVDSALELGRDVYVVPGPITTVHFRGSHQLIQQGAQLLVDPADLLVDLGHTVTHSTVSKVPERWSELYDALVEPQTAASLSSSLNMPPAHLFTGLLELEFAGFVERLPGGLYRRTGVS